ncbi:surfeit locus 1 [Salinisphaera sp. T5B8]|uniref:SURF1 family protein n=1 Tax=unclassified Salinisphaera TaxID=2649847 RepID=UPI003340E56A
MDIGPYRFSPPWWGVLLFALGATIFCALGVWQIERAHYKQRLLEAQQAAQAAAPVAITGQDQALVYGRTYDAAGVYDADRQILLADQTHASQVGYHVWTALRLNDGKRVLVDRGWIARSDSGLPDPAVPAARVQIRGIWQPLPAPALDWGRTSACEGQGWPRVLSYPTIEALRCQYDPALLDGVLLLDASAPGGFVRDWSEETDTVGLRPFGHYAYASQWFLMALVAGVILVVVNLRRR